MAWLLRREGTGGSPAIFDNSSTPLHDVEYYCALDRTKILKQFKGVIFRIVDGRKQTLVVSKYCIWWYGYDSNAGTYKRINHIPRSRIFAYYMRKKIQISIKNWLLHHGYSVSPIIEEK